MKFGNLNKIIIVFFSLSLALGQIARLQYGNVAITALDLIVGLISAGVLIAYIRSGFARNFTGLKKDMILFFISGILGLILFSHNLSLSEIGISLLYPLRLVAYLSVYYWVKNLSKNDRTFFIYSVILAGVFILLIGYVQYFYYPYLRNLYYLGWDDHLYRMFSVFLDPNFAGAFFVVYFFFVLDLLMTSKRTLVRYCYLSIAILTVLAIFLTHSRTGFIMLVVGCFAYAVLHSSRKFAVIIVIALFMLLIGTSNLKIEGLNPLRIASSQARVESLRSAIKIFQTYPIFGVGFNSYRYAQIKMGFREDTQLFVSHADAGTDNSYLFVLATTGILGAIFLLLFCYRAVCGLRVMVASASRGARGLYTGLIAIFVGSLFLNIIFYPMILIWMILQAAFIRSKKP